MANSNQLSFEVINSYDCRKLILADTSVYSGTPEGATLQVMLPDREEVIELTWTTNSVNILNSNSLKYTKVVDQDDLQTLPDGAYTIKISICPYVDNWHEKDIYRICQLQCKYNQALLKLDLSKCESCFSEVKLNKLTTAFVYMQGVIANAENNDITKASELYSVANKILTGLLEDCDC